MKFVSRVFVLFTKKVVDEFFRAGIDKADTPANPFIHFINPQSQLHPVLQIT
jgi:hypothetical protein